MERKFNARYDETEECMYPLPGENDVQFKERLSKLRKERQSTMTDEEKRISRLLAEGKLSEEELQKIIVRE